MNEKSTFGSRVLTANERVHSQLAHKYNETEPHFRPENQAKVRRRLEQIAAEAPARERMLDLGCGTGFIINLARDLFRIVDGVDVTQSMLERVDCSSGNVRLHHGAVEELPFEDCTFDVVTAYSFLDHLADHTLVLREAARVLKRGGILYVDLIPNRSFWDAVYSVAECSGRPFGAIVEREINELVNHQEKLKEQFGIDPQDWQLAEPAKADGRGFDADDLRGDSEDAGFETRIRYEWFLGQAKAMHGISTEAADIIENHLRETLPISDHLFKYVVLIGTKR